MEKEQESDHVATCCVSSRYAVLARAAAPLEVEAAV